MIVVLRWISTIWFEVLVVVADEVSICLKVKILCSISVIYSSSKITARYCSDGRGNRFKFAVDSGSNSGGDWFHATTNSVHI